MSDAVHIELDRPDRVYRPGEIVSGTVVVSGIASRRTQRVVLSSWWSTRGRGTSVRGGKRSAVLHEGPPPPGSVQRHAFRFTAPDSPFTYRGEHLAVDHELHVVVELPLAPDVEGEETFVLVPGSVAPTVPDDLLALRTETPGAPTERLVGVVGLVLFGIGVLTLPVPGVFFSIAGVVALGFGLRGKLAHSRTGKVSVEVEPRVVSPGDELLVAVRLLPPAPLQVEGITATLRAREICVSKKGDSRKTHRHVAHLEEMKLLGPAQLAGELVCDAVGSFTVPALGMWSFKAHHNEVRWEVDVRVRLPGWPDWVTSVPVVVWPKNALPEPEQQRSTTSLPGGGPDAAFRAAETAARRIEDRMARLRPVAKPARSLPAAPTVADPAAAEPSRAERAVTKPAGTKPAGTKPAGTHSATARPAPPQDGQPEPAVARREVDLADGIRGVLEARSNSAERRAQVAALVGKRVDVGVIVARIDRPFGRTRTPGYEEGRVIHGTLADSGLDVEVRVPTSHVHLAQGLSRGDTLVVSGEVASWERLPERPVILVAEAAT